MLSLCSEAQLEAYNFDIILLNFQGCFLFFFDKVKNNEVSTYKTGTPFHFHFMKGSNEAHGPKPRSMSWRSTTDVAFGTTAAAVTAAQRHLRRDLETLIYLMFSREKEEMVMCESQHDISPRRSWALGPYSAQSPQKQRQPLIWSLCVWLSILTTTTVVILDFLRPRCYFLLFWELLAEVSTPSKVINHAGVKSCLHTNYLGSLGKHPKLF